MLLFNTWLTFQSLKEEELNKSKSTLRQKKNILTGSAALKAKSELYLEHFAEESLTERALKQAETRSVQALDFKSPYDTFV